MTKFPFVGIYTVQKQHASLTDYCNCDGTQIYALSTLPF